MPWMLPAAILGSSVIGAAGSAVAAGTQAAGQQTAAQTQWNMFNTINQQEQPFIQAGYGATSQLNSLLAPGGQLNRAFTPQDFLNNLDPGYQFQLQTGGQALRNADTPGVGALSGPALKDLMSFNQSMAATGYQNAFNRFQTQNQAIFSRLFGIAGLGQNAASNVGTSGTTLGTGIAGAQAGAAASQAGGIVGATNALGGSAVPLAYLMSNQQQTGQPALPAAQVSNTGYDPYGSNWGTTGSSGWTAGTGN
jgi:hypothetical protein